MFKSSVSILLQLAKKSRAWDTLKHERGETNYLYLCNIKSVTYKSIAKVWRRVSLNQYLNHVLI